MNENWNPNETHTAPSKLASSPKEHAKSHSQVIIASKQAGLTFEFLIFDFLTFDFLTPEHIQPQPYRHPMHDVIHFNLAAGPRNDRPPSKRIKVPVQRTSQQLTPRTSRIPTKFPMSTTSSNIVQLQNRPANIPRFRHTNKNTPVGTPVNTQ